jgi:hypothetical protein
MKLPCATLIHGVGVETVNCVGVAALTETVTKLGVTPELELENVKGWLVVILSVPPLAPVASTTGIETGLFVIELAVLVAVKVT